MLLFFILLSDFGAKGLLGIWSFGGVEFAVRMLRKA